MPKARISMDIFTEIQRLKALGHSKKKVSELSKINRETVRKYWDRGPLENVCHSPAWSRSLDWEWINKEINSKVPKKILYEELCESADLPSYQAFCKYIKNNFKGDRTKEITIKIHRIPGDSMKSITLEIA